ncbi:hypothetical protein E1A91_A05G301900v1 [Gossypium mustelinum]|uniref:Glutaredoxin domain-containing protein n=1 Tax=Gossypium mustelinum TaxID=34275 RepID=A0A5D2ZCC1_GOSMU|nr:hypothetical protein E1A91_A05G301900v1 [Gossypium mustelinum]
MAELDNSSTSSSSGSTLFNRSFTMHANTAEPDAPKVHLLLSNPSSLNRAASISKIYNSIDSVKGKVKKLCNLFESAKSSLTTGTEDRIVVYLTSLRGIRRTYEDCYAVRMIFRGFRVWVDERDVSMDSAYKKELQSVLRKKNPSLPQVFIKGKYVGGADVIKSMFEVGELAKILEDFPRIQQPGLVCDCCGDVRFVPCGNCNGSRKVFDEDERFLKRCLECNENGLIRCPNCCS